MDMLTKSDLSQIQKTLQDALKGHPTKADLVKELNNHPTKADLVKELNNHPTKADLVKELSNHPTKADLVKELSNHPTKADLVKELKPIKSDIAKIRKDIDAIISLFDREYIDLRKRVERIEEHLNLSELS